MMLDSLVVFRSLLDDPVVRALSGKWESEAISRYLLPHRDLSPCSMGVLPVLIDINTDHY